MARTFAEKGGHFKRALPHFDRALELQPAYGEAYRRRAETRERLGDLQGAVSDYEKAIPSLRMHPKQRAKVQRALEQVKERLGT